jgi:hypothetical protein
LKKFKPHKSVLSAEQQALWPQLAPIKDLGFTLYGGTAVALRLGHRQSVDFDFFTERRLDKNAIHAAVPLLEKGVVLQESPDTLVVSVIPDRAKDPVKVSFFAGMSFGRFGEPELTDDRVLRIASLDDLMGTKIKVLFDRTELKDYDDLAAMIASGTDPARGISIARQMFPNLNPSIALKALTYHKDLPNLSRKARKTLIKAAASIEDLPEVRKLSRSVTEVVEQ